MSPAAYKFAYIPTSDGRFKLAVEVFGPLPDPLAGLDAASRTTIERQKRTWREFTLVLQTLNYPPLARAAVEHHILVTRRQRFEREMRVNAPGVTPAPVSKPPVPDIEPSM